MKDFSKEKVALSYAKKLEEKIHIPVPKGLSYLPYQLAGIKYALNPPYRTLIADDMGLGKTVEAIGFINYMSSPVVYLGGRFLIICPAYLKMNWKAELEKWLVRPMSIEIASSKKNFPRARVVVINYDILHLFKTELDAVYWDTMVLDESHRLQSKDSRRTIMVYGGVMKIKEEVRKDGNLGSDRVRGDGRFADKSTGGDFCARPVHQEHEIAKTDNIRAGKISENDNTEVKDGKLDVVGNLGGGDNCFDRGNSLLGGQGGVAERPVAQTDGSDSLVEKAQEEDKRMSRSAGKSAPMVTKEEKIDGIYSCGSGVGSRPGLADGGSVGGLDSSRYQQGVPEVEESRKCGEVSSDQRMAGALVQREKKVTYKPIEAFAVLNLTGTPAYNRPKNLWTQLKALRPDIWKNWFSFAKRYCAARKDLYGWDFDGSSNEEELGERLRGTCMIRRLKKDVDAQLPEKTRTWLPFEVESSKSKLFPEGQKGDLVFEELAKYRVATGKAKVPFVKELIKSTLESTNRVVVFAYHREVAKKLGSAFSNQASVLMGGDATIAREEKLELFQSGEKPLLIGTMDSIGEGLNLQICYTAIFAELDWAFEKLRQAEDRLLRIGQKNAVQIYYPYLLNSLDDLMRSVAFNKKYVIEKITGG